MKLLTIALALAGAVAFAQPPWREPVEVPAIGFKAVLSDGRVIATWRHYKRDDFASYKLVKSLAKDKPMYPEESPIYACDSAGELRFEDGKLAEGAWHYRLVILTKFGDRWASPVVTINVTPADLKRAAPTEADFEM